MSDYLDALDAAADWQPFDAPITVQVLAIWVIVLAPLAVWLVWLAWRARQARQRN